MHVDRYECKLRVASVVLAIGCLLFCFTACTSKSSVNARENDRDKQTSPTSDLSNQHFDGGTYCVQTLLQGPPPPQPLHFSNKITESDQSLRSKDFEADLSGDTLDIIHHDRWLATDDDRKFFAETRKFDDPKMLVRALDDGFADETVINHFTRSDQGGWGGGVTNIAQGGTPWGLFIYKPPVTRVGTEQVSGYDTIKYAVDTTHQSQMEKSAGFLRQLKDYNITGTAWVLEDANCVLQYQIDDEQIGNDGKTNKTHYEGTVTKK
jgi:hypothetical protein